MSENEEARKSTNVNISLSPYDKAIEKATEGAIDTATKFLNTVCLPGLEEIGGIFKDRVSYWGKCQAL